MKRQISLPTLASYKPQCQHSSANWLLYQSHLEQLRLIDFNPDNSINLTYNISVGSQPLKAARVVYSQEEHMPFVGLALHTKFIIYKRNQLVNSFKLPLNCNITDFSDGFVGVEAVNDGIQAYFVFTTAQGQIFTVPVSHPENKVSFSIDVGSNVTGLCVRDSFAYLGTQNGLVLKVDMNSRKIIQKYDSGSRYPVYHLKISGHHLITGTCYGELHLIDLNLTSSAVVSAHQGLVTLMCISKDILYTVGDECVLRVWKIASGTLTEQHNEMFEQKPNLLFDLNGTVFLNFYEETEASAV